MSLFTGVSIVTGAWDCTTSAVDTNHDSGYHLLVVKNYSQTVQGNSVGDDIRSETFMIGGLNWRIFYYPSGAKSSCADFISFYICPGGQDDEIEETVEVKFQLSFVDQVEYQKPMHILATKTYKLPGPFGACDRFIRREAFERSPHLKGDSFTIRCDIVVSKDFNTHNVDGTFSEIHDHFHHLLENKVGADVTFEVSGEKLRAHRCVLAARSKVLMALLFGPMAESTASGVIEIKDMKVEVFAALLSFIYTDLFPKMAKDNKMEGDRVEAAKQGQEEEPVKYVMWLQDLLVAADRYDTQRLKLLCGEQLSGHICASSVASTLALAEQHYCPGLKEACLELIQAQSLPSSDKVT